jgi:flagellar hook-associated protein 3 FlgL
MRVTESIAYRNLLCDIESLNQAINKASREVSSGKKINAIRDSPSGSAQLVAIGDMESKIDQYTSNVGDGSYFLQVADSALNEVNNLVTSIYTKGSLAGTETIDSNARATIAEEVRSFRDQLLTVANSQARGRYIFAGSQVTTIPFTITGDTVSYQGDSDVNRVLVDEGLEIAQGVSGSEVFDPIFTAIDGLLSGIDGNDIADIQNALKQFSSTLSGLGQVRGKVGANMSLLENVQSRLDLRSLSVAEQKSRIEDADLTEAAIQLKQTQTSLDAAISAGGSLLGKRNLFDIIG